MGAREQQQIIDRYATVQRQLRGDLVTLLDRLWQSLTSWRDPDEFATRAVPLVVGAERAVASLTAAYLAQLLSDMFGSPVAPVGVDPNRVTGRGTRGVDPIQVYRRPVEQVWTDLAADKPLTEAVESGRRRARLLGTTDLQLAKTHTVREVLGGDDRVVGYRRTLTGDESCGLCVVASTQRYRSKDLMPIHPGCDCGVAPIVGDQDPGQVVDRDLLDAAHDAIEERFGKRDAGGRAIDYRKILLVRDHGELGPVLTVAGHRFTGPDALAFADSAN